MNFSKMQPLRSRKRTNMVIDFGSSPVRKHASEESLPELEGTWKDGEEHRFNDDLNENVIRVATAKNLKRNARSNKIPKSTRKTHRPLIGSWSADVDAVDDADVTSARKLFPERNSSKRGVSDCFSDDEDVGSVCSRNFNLETPNFGGRSRGTCRSARRNWAKDGKKNPLFSKYSNGNIASPFMSPRWMVPHRRVPSRSHKQNASNGNGGLNGLNSTSFSSVSSVPVWAKNKTPARTPSSSSVVNVGPRSTPKRPNNIKIPNQVIKKTIRTNPSTKNTTSKWTRTDQSKGKARSSFRTGYRSGDVSPSTPRTPRDSLSDLDSESVASLSIGSPELELVCKDRDGVDFCVQTLQKLSPISRCNGQNARKRDRDTLWQLQINGDSSMFSKATTQAPPPTPARKDRKGNHDSKEYSFVVPNEPDREEAIKLMRRSSSEESVAGDFGAPVYSYRTESITPIKSEESTCSTPALTPAATPTDTPVVTPNASTNCSRNVQSNEHPINETTVSAFTRSTNDDSTCINGIHANCTNSNGNITNSTSGSFRTPINGNRNNNPINTSLKPPLHDGLGSPRNLDSLLSPDPRAFDSTMTVFRKTPASACPPTPVARPRMHRSTSLGQTKMLSSTNSLPAPLMERRASKFSQSFHRKKLVGEGSFFKVYKIYMRSQKGRMSAYALKSSKRAFRSKNDRAMYLKEVELVKSLPSHPNIVKYIAAWQEELHFYVIMEYCYCTLEKLVSMVKVDERFKWNVLFQVARALEHIHKHGVLHMDVKPGNILYGIDKVLKLADFGQAIATNRRSQMLDGCEGDSMYMAPELMQHNVIPTEAADLFSLGLLMVEIATRKPLPTEGPNWQNLRKGRAREYCIGRVGRSLEKTILRMLEPKPYQRPSAAQVASVAEEWLKRKG
mmetsp:Transcript_25477/g.61358  ORF Transcript_25477/g.61358 Transcript_25477/m.61358 type:complete len:901 (-) Transcript_25477:325-3027(-)